MLLEQLRQKNYINKSIAIVGFLFAIIMAVVLGSLKYQEYSKKMLAEVRTQLVGKTFTAHSAHMEGLGWMMHEYEQLTFNDENTLDYAYIETTGPRDEDELPKYKGTYSYIISRTMMGNYKIITNVNVYKLSVNDNNEVQGIKIAREKKTRVVPKHSNAYSEPKQKTDDEEKADVTEFATESEETDRDVKIKSETERVEPEESKEVVSEPKKETSTVSENKPKQTIHTYEVIAGDVSWEAAKSACEERGGYLATITSKEEYDKISEMAERSGLTYLWLGAKLQTDTEEWTQAGWITGEDWTFENWYPGEPSRQDADGTKELFLCMWKAKYNEEELGWTFNDQRNDIVGAFPKIAGKVGYVCEYERETGE